MKNCEISQQLVQAIGAYLATKPWQEVNGFIQQLLVLKEIKDEKDTSRSRPLETEQGYAQC